MDEHIAIAVGKRSLFTGDFYASDDERFAGGGRGDGDPSRFRS
ncbi:MAG: hypothetical protein ACOXZ7_00785 [Sphaerochaeta sp.]